jgi:hypothetical protein
MTTAPRPERRICLAAMFQGALMSDPMATEDGWEFLVDEDLTSVPRMFYVTEGDKLVGQDLNGHVVWEDRVDDVLRSRYQRRG